jgi:hypothetical protein
MKRLLLLSLFLGTLVPFSLSGMEKEKALFSALKRFNGDERAAKEIYDLLETGANANALNRNGYTPLAVFALHLVEEVAYGTALPTSYEFVIESLLEHEAGINKIQSVYFPYTNNYARISNYDLLKYRVPNLDVIIKKVENKIKKAQEEKRKIASDKKYTADFTKTAQNTITVDNESTLSKHNKAAQQNNLKTNQSIVINGREFKLNEAFSSVRCSKLFEVNLPAKQFLYAPLVTRNVNVANLARIAGLIEQANQETNKEKDRSIEITEID